MTDCPKCIPCLKKGLVGQTYKMVGSANVMCHDCKKIKRISEFEPIEFEWRDNSEEYQNFIKGVNIGSD